MEAQPRLASRNSHFLHLAWLLFLPVCLAVPSRAEDIRHAGTLLIGVSNPDEIFDVGPSTDYYQTGDIGITNRGRLRVRGRLHLTGHLYLTESGLADFDGGELHLAGRDTQVYVRMNARLFFRNQARLHYIQSYVGQHNLIGWENAAIDIRDTTVEADGSIEFIHLKDQASYTGANIEFHHWKTWYLYNHSALYLENVDYGGDIVFYDAPTMRFKNVEILMPWLQVGSGAQVDTVFPAPTDGQTTITIRSGTSGFSGIPWSLTLEDCRRVMWGVSPYPGSSVTVRNSSLTMVMFRFFGSGRHEVQGTMVNNSHYDDVLLPVADRAFRLVNTDVKWWKVDVFDSAELRADSLALSEMVNRGTSRTTLAHSRVEGQTVHLGTTDDSFTSFNRGEVWSYVSSFLNGTLVLSDSVVDWQIGQAKNGFTYQKENIAHQTSRLYCLNTTMREPPQAMDQALALFAFIDPVSNGRSGSSQKISGSAWVDAGPISAAKFLKYELAWAPDGSSNWLTFATSSNQIHKGSLGTWDTRGLAPGAYRLRLTVFTQGDEGWAYPSSDFPAYRDVRLFPSKTAGRPRVPVP